MSKHAWLFEAMQALLDGTSEDGIKALRWKLQPMHIDELKSELGDQWETAFGDLPYDVVDSEEGAMLVVGFPLSE